MLRAALVAAALLPLLIQADPGWALPKNTLGNSDQCICSCETASGSSTGRYNSNGINCTAFNDATCNRENAQGLIETGKLTGCATIFNLKDYLILHPNTPLHSPPVVTTKPSPTVQ